MTRSRFRLSAEEKVIRSLPTFEPDDEDEDRWQDKGSCRGLTDVYYGPKNERPAARAEREALARRICSDCPVLPECSDYSLRHREPGGVWAGISFEPDPETKKRKKRSRQSAAEPRGT